MKTAIIGCSKRKLPVRCPAKWLYSASPRFSMLYQFACTETEQQLILSGKHGLLQPMTVIEPYEYRVVDGDTERLEERIREMIQLIKGEIMIYGLGVDYKQLLEQAAPGRYTYRFSVGADLFTQARISRTGKRLKAWDWPMHAVLKVIYASGGMKLSDIRTWLRSKGYAPATIEAQTQRVKRCPLFLIKLNMAHLRFRGTNA